MLLKDFYTIAAEFRRGVIATRPVGMQDCDIFAILRGEVPPPDELIFKQASGTRLKDFVDSGFAAWSLISRRVVDLFTERQFTGWKAYPATIILKKGERHDGHFLLVVTGRSGPVDQSKAPIIRKPPVVVGGAPYSVWQGLHFDPATWDGSDFFVPENHGWMVVTKAVRDCLIREKVTNVSIENCAEVEQMVYKRSQ